MRVVVLSGGCPSDAYPFNGIFQFEQAKALKAAGHEVLFAVADLRSLRRKRPLGFVESEREGLRVLSMSLPVGAVPPPIAGAAAVAATAVLFGRIARLGLKPDIVHAHFAVYYGMAAARNMARLPGTALVVTEHASEIILNEVSPYSMKCMRLTYDAADAVIAVSGHLSARIRELTGTEAVIVPNMFNDSLFFPATSPATTSVSTKASPVTYPAKAHFSFVSVGHLVLGKGMERLIESYARAFGADPRYSLTILGEGPERRSLEAKVTTLGLGSRVRMLGSIPRTEIAATLRGSDCFVTASEYETFGLACVEALASGLPVVATRCGGPEDFVGERNGLLVDVGDVEGMAEAMKFIAGKRGRIDRAAIAATVARFSSSSVIAAVGAVYGEALRSQEGKGTSYD